LNDPDEISEVAHENRPGESEQSALTLPKASETRGRSRAFEPLMIGCSAFYGVQNLHPIVMTVPLHLSDCLEFSKS
jgi:hypothetical protein